MGGAKVHEALKELGLAASKSRGQNFLKDESLIRRLAEAVMAEAGPAPEILEIGPGLGALTRPLLAAGARIMAVELDRGLAENLARLAGEYPGRLTVLNRDILTLTDDDLAGNDPAGNDPAANDLAGNDLAGNDWAGKIPTGQAPRFLCGNLPYNISSPVLFWFLAHRRYFSGAVFMLQKEMAQRLTAGPGGKEYGRLSVALSLWCRVRPLFAAPAAAFHPRPKVESAVVALRPVRPEEEPAVGPETLGRFTAAAFAARRQTIFNNLARAYGRPAAAAALASLGLEPGQRAETFDPPTLAALAAILKN